MKQKIFNVVVYGMLAYTMLNAIYIALPVEYQEMIPQWNSLTALVSGGSTFLIGMGGLTYQSYIARAKAEADSKFSLLASNYVELANHYKVLEGQVKSLDKNVMKQNTLQERTNRLITTDLKAKLSNPLIDEQVEKMINEVLNDE